MVTLNHGTFPLAPLAIGPETPGLNESDWIVYEATPSVDVLADTLLALRTFWGSADSPDVFNRYRAALDELTRGHPAMAPHPTPFGYIYLADVGGHRPLGQAHIRTAPSRARRQKQVPLHIAPKSTAGKWINRGRHWRLGHY